MCPASPVSLNNCLQVKTWQFFLLFVTITKMSPREKSLKNLYLVDKLSNTLSNFYFTLSWSADGSIDATQWWMIQHFQWKSNLSWRIWFFIAYNITTLKRNFRKNTTNTKFFFFVSTQTQEMGLNKFSINVLIP